MLRVALTGNIASGKSAVADAWRRNGADIIDADVLAREAVAPGSPGLARVVEAFGPGVLARDATLDRSALRRIVFEDDAKRSILEAILHPEIRRLRADREKRLESVGARIVVNVIPLLFETGLEGAFDEIVLVDAPESVRLMRLVRLRGLSDTEARGMIAAQMPAAAKRAGATIVIENDGTLEDLEARAGSVWRELEAKAAACA